MSTSERDAMNRANPAAPAPTGFWAGLSRPARIGVATGAALIVGTTIAVGAWLMRTDYQPLFSQLSAADAAAMVTELDRMKVPYRLGEDGTAILVERDAVHRTRLKLMGKDLPLHGTVGFELFNNSDFGMTEFAQKVNYQRALQGEIARTILSLSEVASVRVHLAMPEEGLFKRNASRPKASVTLALKTGQALRAEQITGIQRLVSSSVPGISPQDVTLVDQRGVALTRAPGDADGAEPTSARLDLKKEMETYLQRKVESILAKTLGPDQSSVAVDVTLDMDQVKISTEDVVPGSQGGRGTPTGVIVRERESIRDAGPMITARDGGSAGAGSAQREIEYQVGRRVEHVVSQPGSIKRLQIVAITHFPLEPERLESLRQLVGAAVGATRERGDTVVVQAMEGVVDTAEAQAQDEPAGAPASATPEGSQRSAGNAGSQGADNAGAAGVIEGRQSVWTPWDRSVRLAAVCALLGVLAAIGLIVWRRRTARGAQPVAMTDAQRAQAIERLRGWLQEDRAAGMQGDLR